jgi:hypothetical protein
VLHSSSLHSHPATPCPAVSALHVSSCALADGAMRLRFQLEGEMHALRIPGAAEAGFADELWQHTCFEAFIAMAGSPAYREFNFSPSGEWAAYAFTDYRQRDMSWTPAAAPRMHLRATPESLDLEVTLPAALLCSPCGPLDISLTAVIETSGLTLSYWALAHPGERPDFHQRAAFTLRLAPHTDLP